MSGDSEEEAFSLLSTMEEGIALRDGIIAKAYPSWERSERMKEPYAGAELLKAMARTASELKSPSMALAVILTASPGDFEFATRVDTEFMLGLLADGEVGVYLSDKEGRTLSDQLVRFATAVIYSRMWDMAKEEREDKAK